MRFGVKCHYIWTADVEHSVTALNKAALHTVTAHLKIGSYVTETRTET